MTIPYDSGTRKLDWTKQCFHTWSLYFCGSNQVLRRKHWQNCPISRNWRWWLPAGVVSTFPTQRVLLRTGDGKCQSMFPSLHSPLCCLSLLLLYPWTFVISERVLRDWRKIMEQKSFLRSCRIDTRVLTTTREKLLGYCGELYHCFCGWNTVVFYTDRKAITYFVDECSVWCGGGWMLGQRHRDERRR
jgi:hypothetical protein